MNLSFVFKDSEDYSLEAIINILKKFSDCNAKISVLEKYRSEFKNFNLSFYENIDTLVKNSEMVVVCGGDGTIMHIAKKASRYKIPVFGINYGRLGFMSSVESSNLDGIDELMSGKYKISSRMMLKIKSKYGESYALNDLVVNRKLNSQIVDCKVLSGSEKICFYRADGLIISTPTGSTAYSLSAGGPIIESNMECFLISPVCAHTLSARSIVLNSDMNVKLNYLPKVGSGIVVTIDGNVWFESNEPGILEIEKSELYSQFVELNSCSFYSNIDTKLMNKFFN